MSRTKEMKRVDDLPNDCLCEICHFLTPSELHTLSITSKKWGLAIISKNDRIWKPHFEKLKNIEKYRCIVTSIQYKNKITDFHTEKEKYIFLFSIVKKFTKIENLELENVVYPKSPKDFKGKIEKYQVHDNGGRPFEYEISENEIKISSQNGDSVYTYENWKNVFIGVMKEGKLLYGADPSLFEGNTIIFETNKKGEWIGFNCGIWKFFLEEEIWFYISVVGNSDVPYPFFICEDFSCMIFDEYNIVRNEDFLYTQSDEKDMVNRFYGMNRNLVVRELDVELVAERFT